VKDWTLREVVCEAEVSAKSLKRPGLAHVLGLVKAGAVGAVVVYKLDRLTCSVVDLDRLLKLFERHGVALVSLQESLDATTATGRLMMNLLASVSQWEREVIGECTREAMQHLKATGQVHCRPACTDPKTLARMRRLRTTGLSYQAIAEALTATGMPTVRGGRWAGTTVWRLLRSWPASPKRRAA
jgi:site-specific DNA recombinase